MAASWPSRSARRVDIIDFVRPPKMALLVVLDRVSNPHNLGAIARSAAFFGAGGLLFHEVPGQAWPSDAAYRTAEGGLEYLELHKTRNLPKALEALEPHYRTVAATLARDAMPLQSLPRDRPIALVLGNEEVGVSVAAAEACRRRVRILGAGPVQSLNVAQAAAVLLAALTNPCRRLGCDRDPAAAPEQRVQAERAAAERDHVEHAAGHHRRS